ncbi:MAG TPA: alpha-ketoglutarate-dependent dioxygenase AlkB [Pyrinomonadaceae bacterium]|nr:alpha-ketoglutarate-dependent dioxygenase AlkB [Pyrinomonadaceae bacterium]
MPPTRKTIRSASPPEGFRYVKNIITPDEESELVRHIEKLPLKEFEFQGYLAKRRTASFGWHYKFGEEALERAEPIPHFLIPLRDRAAAFADLGPDDLPHVLVTEYSPGTPIGWHRDKAVFEDVIGVSLLSRCLFRLRRKTPGGWERYTHILEPRSGYLLRAQVRGDWEHSIPEVDALRYSITFRSLR